MVSVTMGDHSLSPAALTARTCTSYPVLPVSPVREYCSGPPPVVPHVLLHSPVGVGLVGGSGFDVSQIVGGDRGAAVVAGRAP